MTPAQQSALEGLVGRALSAAESAELEPYLDYNNRNDVAITAIVNRLRPKKVSDYWLTDQAMVGEMVKSTGDRAMSNSILTKLDTLANSDRSIKSVANRLMNDARGVNFGDAALRAQIQALGALPAGGFSAGEVDALLALPMQADPLPMEQVSLTMSIAEGRMVP